ncbi:L-type lectin-like domain-containing protein [Diplonema papillatum]|nr:L-type lectin-like domain-containing protein [Diplonema papillatum]
MFVPASWKAGLLVAVLAVASVAAGPYAFRKEDMSHALFKEHSFQAPFLVDWWQGGIPNWKLRGDAVILDNSVRLTPALSSRSGAIVNEIPVEVEHWELMLRFRIHGKANPGADGFALWYTAKQATGGQFWGNEKDFKGFGLIFDTYDNNGKRDQPSISLIVNWEGFNHIDWKEEDDLASKAIFRCSHEFRNTKEGQEPQLRIIYRYKKLEFFLKQHNSREYFCGQLERTYLPRGYFFSIGAKTGGAADNHEIMSFQVTGAPGVLSKDRNEGIVHNPKIAEQERQRHAVPRE